MRILKYNKFIVLYFIAACFSFCCIGCIADWNPNAPYSNGQPRWERKYSNGINRTHAFNRDGSVYVTWWRRLGDDGLYSDEIRQIVWDKKGDVVEMRGEYKYRFKLTRRWYPNGQQWFDISRLKGRERFHGRCTWWHKNGKIRSDCEYVNHKEVRNYIKEGTPRSALPRPNIKPNYGKNIKIPQWQER